MAKPYNFKKIGKFLGSGGEHLVFAYGADNVIKFSMHVWITGRSVVRNILADHKLALKYFEPYYVAPELHVWDAERKMVEIQPRVHGRHLHKKDLVRPKIREQLRDIVERHDRMHEAEGRPFDFFGFHGIVGLRDSSHLSNILITPDDSLKIVDFSTMHRKPSYWHDWLIWFFIRWARDRQAHLLKKHWLPHLFSHTAKAA